MEDESIPVSQLPILDDFSFNYIIGVCFVT